MAMKLLEDAMRRAERRQWQAIARYLVVAFTAALMTAVVLRI